MFNVKWGIIAGVIAFALAFLTSLLMGHTSAITALLRAASFAVLFFGLGIGVWMLINAFIPELLFTDSRDSAAHNVFASVPPPAAPTVPEAPAPGARVNITLDDNDSIEAALPSESGNTNEIDEVGDFGDLASGTDSFPEKSSPDSGGDIDQTPISDYNDVASMFSPAPNDKKDSEPGEFSMDFGSFGSSIGETESGASFSDSFSLPSGNDNGSEQEEEDYIPPPPPAQRRTGNKPVELKGDFDPKELAAGIRTVLEKEKRG